MFNISSMGKFRLNVCRSNALKWNYFDYYGKAVMNKIRTTFVEFIGDTSHFFLHIQNVRVYRGA